MRRLAAVAMAARQRQQTAGELNNGGIGELIARPWPSRNPAIARAAANGNNPANVMPNNNRAAAVKAAALMKRQRGGRQMARPGGGPAAE